MNPSAHELVAPPMTSVLRAHISTAGRTWLGLTLCASVAVAVLDAALLQRKYNFFTGGFLTPVHLDSFGEGLSFFALSTAVNWWLVAPLSAIGLSVANRLHLRLAAARFLTFSVCVLPLAAADFLAYEVWVYLGNAFDFDVLFALTGRRPSEIIAVTAPLLARPALLALVGAACVAGVTWILQRRSRSVPMDEVPPLRHILRGCAACLLLGVVLVGAAALSGDEAVQWGLRKLPAAQPLVLAFERLSDFDGDGYGLMGRLRDPAPFNSALHPYALEIPGNGIDEDGVGGDLPLDRAQYREPPPPAAAWPETPPVILFVLESFRADVIGAQQRSQPVTPVLDRLAREGLKVDSAWSHNGFTSQSRFHILTGSVADARQGTSLLDDFKNHGYEVAYFSAQDDGFGDAPVGYDRVDTYYDARRDIENRYTTYTTPGSLAVPAKVLEKRIRDFLSGRHRSSPLFLYANFHDTHYPYVHRGLDNLLNVNLLSPGLISPQRRDDLWATYLNTAANIDRAIGNVLNAVTAQVGTAPAVIVLSDHGESLFDEGFLGHGYALNDSQTRIPLIVSGLPMKVRIPFGQADLRDSVNSALAGTNGRLGVNRPVEGDSSGRVFQYLGPLDAPAEIAWLTRSGRLIYDFRLDEASVGNEWMKPSALSDEAQRNFQDLVFRWESMRLERARIRAARAVREPSGFGTK